MRTGGKTFSCMISPFGVFHGSGTSFTRGDLVPLAWTGDRRVDTSFVAKTPTWNKVLGLSSLAGFFVTFLYFLFDVGTAPARLS